MSVRVSDRRRATDVRAKGPNGVYVASTTGGREQLVMSDQEICDDIIATIPKLHAAVKRETDRGARWKPKARKDGVELFEMNSVGASEDPNDDLDIVHAVVAKTEIKCHLNEALDVLVTLESHEYEATMKALNGKKFARGDVLFQQQCAFTPSSSSSSSSSSPTTTTTTQQKGLITVQMATLRPKHTLSLKTKHKRTQKLCFATCTHRYPTGDRAVHVMKTLPKRVHDQIVPAEDRSALRRELDHLGVGFDLQSTHRDRGGSANQTTKLFAYGYASTLSPAAFGQTERVATTQSTRLSSPSDVAKQRDAIMNPEAKHVLTLLTESLTQFERVIRRRRFGFQSFIYFPPGYDDDPSLVKSCSICAKAFKFYRRDFFCQLCGHMVCGDCSQLYDVEARIGDVRKNRACLHCVFRVDACTFNDEALLSALGPVVVDTEDDAAWFNDDLFHLPDAAVVADGSSRREHYSDTDETLSDSSEDEDEEDESHLDALTGQLTSADPVVRSQALDALSRLIGDATTQPPYTFVDPTLAHVANKTAKKKKTTTATTTTNELLERVENHVSQRLRAVKDQYTTQTAATLAVSDRVRDYQLAYDATQTVNAHHPLPPMPAAEKEQRRLQLIDESGVLDATFDGSALDLIAQVAAKRLNCPIGFVSVVDADAFHAIGKYQLPEVAFTCPRNENMCIHTVYAEQPLIVKNPQRDMRFAQLSTVQELGVKFYAGFPVHAPDGTVIASLCAADSVPHNHLTAKEYATMEALAKLASELVVPTQRRV